MGDFAYMTAIELKDRIARKEVSPVDVVEASLRRMEALEPTLNCFVEPTPDMALDAARAAEQAVTAGQPLGLLHGLPISIKDLITVGGVRSTVGSKAMVNSRKRGRPVHRRSS